MQADPTGAANAVHRFRCPGCGADLAFAPKDGNLGCPYCGRVEHIPESAEEVVERSYEDYLHPRPEQMTPLMSGALEVSCASCGATVTFAPPEVARQCDFCGSSIVAQPKSADPVVAPEGVLPFKLDHRESAEAVHKWISTRWFAPNALKKFASHDAISGVYLPFWTYDAYTTSHYTGARGEYYYVTETHQERDAQGNMVTRTRQVRHTRWFGVSGEVDRWFDDLLVAATTSVARNRLDALEPWDVGEIKAYEPAYLAGYKAQRYQIDLSQGFEIAKDVMAPVIRSDVRADIGGDEQRIDSVATHYSGITFKHLLLPVYIGAYRFRQKVYQVMVNGRTGEVQGDRPYSFWKIAFLVVVILLVIGLLIYLGDS